MRENVELRPYQIDFQVIRFPACFFLKQIILPSARIIKKDVNNYFCSGHFSVVSITNRRRFSNVSAL